MQWLALIDEALANHINMPQNSYRLTWEDMTVVKWNNRAFQRESALLRRPGKGTRIGRPLFPATHPVTT